jgi:hypothetical protein
VRGCRLLIVKTTAALLFVLWSIAVGAQIKIDVPNQAFKSHDRIDVEIVNAGASDATFCVEYGYVSYLDSGRSEPTPTPVYVQQKVSRSWSTLMTGPDIGSARTPVTLKAEESQHYPFRVNAHGTVRLVLDYWLGSGDHQCGDTKGRKTAFSRGFQIE